MSIRRNALWNLTGSAVPLVAGVAFIPFTLSRLGNEAFGVLTLIWGLIGYFTLFDLGVGRALTVRLSQSKSSEESSQLASTLRAGMALTAATGLLGGMLVAGLAPTLATHWLNISVPLQEDAKWAFWIAAAGVLPTTLASGLRGALGGVDRFAASNVSRMVLGIWMFVLPAFAVWLHGPQLWLITVYLVLGRCLVVLGMTLQLRRLLTQGGWGFAKQDLQGLWNFGFWVTVTGIVGPLMVYGDRFFVSAAVGAEQLPLYAIPQEGLLRLLLIPMALTGALLPHLAVLGLNQLGIAYRQSYKKVAWVMLAVCSLAAALAFPVLSVWISEDFAQQAIAIVWVLCVGVWVNSLASVPYTLLHAKGNPRLTALFHLAELALYMVALWWLSSRYGLLGASIAWAARVTLDWVFLHLAVRRIYGL
jgi:O-antigen/teichoic acid export membrane protein